MPVKKHSASKSSFTVVAYTDCDPVSQFSCHNKQCISISAHCDHSPDCADGSDESNDTCPTRPERTCPLGQWKCPVGPCLDEAKVCDGVSDCLFEDEMACGKYPIGLSIIPRASGVASAYILQDWTFLSDQH